MEVKPKEKKEKTIYMLLSYQVNNTEKDISEVMTFFEKLHSDFKVLSSKKDENENKTNFIEVLSFTFNNQKKSNIIKQYSTEKYKYTLEIFLEDTNFIYDLQLIKIDSLELYRNEISQNQISYIQKFEFFFSSIKENKELLGTLYTDTIKIYKDHPKFDFLIEIFVRIYRDKNLCSLLLTEFKTFNGKLKSKNKDPKKKNIVFSKDLDKYKNILINISNESSNIIKQNSYAPDDFYGIIFCYLNHYAHDVFIDLFKKLMNNSKNALFEILLTYIYFFKEPIVENDEFLIEFMDYVIKKKSYEDLSQKCILYYKNLDILFEAIETHKEKIIKIEGFKPIEIKDFNIESNFSIEKIIKKIGNILEFSKNNKLLVILKNSFWEKFLLIFDAPTKTNILQIYLLLQSFNNYYSLIDGELKKILQVFMKVIN